MSNKFNRRNNSFARNKSTQSVIHTPIKVKIISECGETNNHLLLLDENGIVVSYPKTLVYANSLKIEDDSIKLSQSMYDTWFKSKLALEINELSEKLFNNFDLIIRNSDIILSDDEFSNLHLPFLKSTVLYSGSIIYPLGKVLKSWMYKEDLRLSSSAYMLKINVSPLSGVNNYTGYSTKSKKIFTGSLGVNDKHWKDYLDEFYSFTPFKQNKNELLVLTRLLFALGIDC